jgi:hypothetical protein
MAFVFDGGVGTCGASGRSLVDDFRQALDDNTSFGFFAVG